jgi:hypothetical protein
MLFGRPLDAPLGEPSPPAREVAREAWDEMQDWLDVLTCGGRGATVPSLALASGLVPRLGDPSDERHDLRFLRSARLSYAVAVVRRGG